MGNLILCSSGELLMSIDKSVNFYGTRIFPDDVMLIFLLSYFSTAML